MRFYWPTGFPPDEGDNVVRNNGIVDANSIRNAGELNRRAKNTLAVMQAIAAQTFRDEPVSEGAWRAFNGRLAALAAANDALIRSEWRAASLPELVAAAVRAHCGGADEGRFEVAGPDLIVPARAAVGFSLILHELCTNAAK